jgi:hypothetical protein
MRALALMDTNIPFSTIQREASQIRQWAANSSLFKSNSYIHLNQINKQLIDVVDATQVVQFEPLTEKKVHIGTHKAMLNFFPDECKNSMQNNPDIQQNFTDSSFIYQGNIGIDVKRVTQRGITNPNYNQRLHGRNQVLVTNLDQYLIMLDTFANELEIKHGKSFKDIVKTLYITANNFEDHIQTWAYNLHKFPPKWAPPLLMTETLPKNKFIPAIQEQIDEEKRFLRSMSRKAYEMNIPEDNFNESHVQALMEHKSSYNPGIEIPVID